MLRAKQAANIKEARSRSSMCEFQSSHQFIVQCLQHPVGATPVEARSAICRDVALDWDAVIRTAGLEMVLPTLSSKLEALGILNAAPSHVANFFRDLRELSSERNGQILREVVTVSKLLNAVGIEPVALKGVAYLLTGVYQDISARFISDIDLLVPAPALMKAIQALTGADYIPANKDFGHHYFPLRRPANIWVEIHHSIGGRTSRSILPSSEMLKDSVVTGFQGAKIRLPSPEHLITHHVVHAQIHHAHAEGIWPPLRTMCDLALLLERFGNEVDWSSVQARFRRNCQEGALAIHLLLAERVWGIKPPLRIRMNSGTKLRLHRIDILRRFPNLRWIDPVYMFSRGVIPRVREIENRISVGRLQLPQDKVSTLKVSAL